MLADILTEPVILAIITVVFGGIISIALKNIEGKHATRVEEIKSQAATLEAKISSTAEDKAKLEIENVDLEKEVKALEQEIILLEKTVDRWRTRSHRIEEEMHELRLIFLRIMKNVDIPTDQFEDLVAQINKRIQEENEC